MSQFLVLNKELPSHNGYLIRPYVQLTGQKKGYYLTVGKRGFWRTFIELNKVNYTFENTGKHGKIE